jgi:hypothetical protein
MLASDYPLLNVFWTMLWFFFFTLWIWTVITVLVDIFRSHDMHGMSKALWFLLVVFLPVLGVLSYLIVRGDKIGQHAATDAEERDAELRAYVQSAAGTTSAADEITKLASLRDKGVISVEEFTQQKTLLLQ